MRRLLLFFAIMLLAGSSAFAQRIYNWYSPGDWVTYTDTRYVTSIARGFNTVYFGTSGGILRYDMQAEKWLDPITVSDGLPDNRIRRLAVDRLTDEIWVDTPHGGSYYSPTSQDWSDNLDFPMDKVQSSGVSLGDLPNLFPSNNYQYLPGGTLVDRNMIQYPITQMLRDEDDVVWMGLWGLGPAEADLRRDDLKIMCFGPYDADIAYLDKDGENFWLLGGSDGLPGSITHYDRSSDQWEYIEPQNESGVISDRFTALAHDDKNVWMGTDMGLVRMDKRTGSFKSYSHFEGIYGTQVNSLLPIKNNLLIGTDMGVSVYDLVRDSIYPAVTNAIQGRAVYCFAIRGRTIYAGTQFGLYSLDWGTSQWQQLSVTSGDLRGGVYDMQVVDSLLYTAGDDGLVILNLADSSEVVYDRNTKFGNSILTKLLVHQGVLWVGTSSGLYRFNKRIGTWYRYTQSDGLISQRITSLVGDGDFVWIGTDKGVSRFRWKSYNRSDWLQ